MHLRYEEGHPDDMATRLKTYRPPARWTGLVQRVTFHGDLPWRALITGMAVLVIIVVLAIGVQLWRETPESRSAFGLGFLRITSAWRYTVSASAA